MKSKRLRLLSLLAIAMLAIRRLAIQVMVARAVSPPHVSNMQLLKVAMNPPYEI
jgi:hypothetical protein